MGILDIFRRTPQLRAKALAPRYGLRYTRSDNPVIAGSIQPDWWFGETGGVMLTLREIGGVLEVVVGEMLPGVDYVLARVNAKYTLPEPGSEWRLDSRVRGRHPALTRWIFATQPQGRAELAPLENPDVLDALAGLSDNVSELAIYRWGVEMRYPRTADEADLHRDIALARRIRLPMEPYRQAYLDAKRACP